MINSTRVLVFAMLSTASGWGLPSQDSPNESTDITGGVDGARDRRQLGSPGCDEDCNSNCDHGCDDDSKNDSFFSHNYWFHTETECDESCDGGCNAHCEWPLPSPVWVGCFANSGADRVNGHTVDKSMDDCSPLALALGVPGFGMEYPQGYGKPGSAQFLPLTTVPPAMTKVADADCEVEMYNEFRLGGAYRLAVYSYLKPPVWVGCFANSGADRIWGHTVDKSTDDCSPLALALGAPGFGMEHPGGYGYGKAQCLPLTTVPPALTKVADADCEVERYNEFRLGGAFRLAVYAYPKPPVWVGCFANSGADRIWGHKNDQSMDDCSTRALALDVPGFGMEHPGGYGYGKAQCLPLTTVPPALTKVADADCEVETYYGFRLGGAYRLAVYRS